MLLLLAGQMSDHKGARLILDVLPARATLIADRGYDSRPFREALVERGITPCIPSSRSRKRPYPYDAVLYRASVIGSRTCSPASRTGAVSPPATINAPTPS